MRLEILSIETIREIYNKYLIYDFPKDEVKPLSRIEQMYNQGVYFAVGMYECGKLSGYAFFVLKRLYDGVNNTALMDYFAIMKDMRGTGVGSRFLKEVPEFLKDLDCIILETEDIDYALNETDREVRERRIRFYKKNGLIMTNIKAKVFGVNYNIMYLSFNAGKTNGVKQENIIPENIIEENIIDEKTIEKCVKEIYDVMFDEKHKDQVHVELR